MIMNGCPGAAALRGAPDLKIKTCPECGGEIELFSNETHSACENCGFVAYNDTASCISWCSYAKDCVGEDVYNRFMQAQAAAQAQREAEG